MNNLVLRAISGTVYIVVILACLLLGSWWFYGLTLAFIVLGLHEFHSLESHRNGSPLTPVTIVVDYVAALTLWGASILFLQNNFEWLTVCGGLFLASLALILCNAVFDKSDHALSTAAYSVLSVVYLALPMSLLTVVYTLAPGGEGKTLILVSFVCIWINDTGAYLVGSKLGRRRLCQRLSPKKSWEGFWGGLALVVIAISIYAVVKEHNVVNYAVYGAVVSVLATVGDLFESLLKRTAGVKDSGKLIPGHGGILDRIDSFLFVSYTIIIMGCAVI